MQVFACEARSPIPLGLGSSPSVNLQDEQTSTDGQTPADGNITSGDSTGGRNVFGFEDMNFPRLSGEWKVIDSVLVYRSPNIAFKADMTSFNPNIRLKASDGILVWAYADKPNQYNMTPLTANFTAQGQNYKLSNIPIIVSTSGFEAVNDTIYETPSTSAFVYDRIETEPQYPWETIVFFHSTAQYSVTTMLENVSYDPIY